MFFNFNNKKIASREEIRLWKTRFIRYKTLELRYRLLNRIKHSLLVFWIPVPHSLYSCGPTSFPGLQCEDEVRDEEALVWAGHVSTQKMAVFDSYSSRSGEILFNEIYKFSKQINSQKTSQSILFMCRAKFGTNQLKSMKTPSMFSKIYRYFWRFSTTGKAASKLHLGVSMQVVIHTKFSFSRFEQYGYCYN